jgi:hypothetical protein
MLSFPGNEYSTIFLSACYKKIKGFASTIKTCRGCVPKKFKIARKNFQDSPELFCNKINLINVQNHKFLRLCNPFDMNMYEIT